MMMKAVLSLTLLAALATPAIAQVPGAPATIVTRSGDRIAADVIDIAAPGLLIRQNGQERNLATSDVSQIDFAGDGRSPARQWRGAADHSAEWSDRRGTAVRHRR